MIHLICDSRNFQNFLNHTNAIVSGVSKVQTRAHTGLGPGVSNDKVLRRRVCTATHLCTVALRQYCQCAPDCSTPRSQTLSYEDYARPVSFSAGLGLFFFFFFKNFLCTAYRKDNDSKYANDKNCLPDIETTKAD